MGKTQQSNIIKTSTTHYCNHLKTPESGAKEPSVKNTSKILVEYWGRKIFLSRHGYGEDTRTMGDNNPIQHQEKML